MDLICTIYTPSKKDPKCLKGPLQSKWSYESVNLCSVSSQNLLLFVSSFPLESSGTSSFSDYSTAVPSNADHATGEKFSSSKSGKILQLSSDGSASNCLHHVFVTDLNTPWDVHRVTSRASEITILEWEPEVSTTFVLTDKDGLIEVWQMADFVITEWHCVVRTTQFPAEVFLTAKFLPVKRKVCLSQDKLDSANFNDKFQFRQTSDLSNDFSRKDLTCCVLISHTALAVALTFSSPPSPIGDEMNRSLNGSLRVCSKSLASSRFRIKHGDMSFLKDGTLLAAVTNGDPKSQVRFFSLVPEILDLEEKHSLDLKVETYPGLFLQSQNGQNHKGLNDEDACQAIVGLRFVTGDDCDSILVASHHPSGGRVELWELREMPFSTNKMFQMGLPDAVQSRKIVVPTWHYVEVFTLPAAQVMCLATPRSIFQTGRAAACYVTIAYSDGSIQCLLRDSLQQIGSADLPKTGNIYEEPANKMSRTSVTICDMQFTATGNALVVIDSLGQLYIYRMSPISDPGGLHNPSHVVTMLEYCLVSGLDWWDLTICAKPGQIDMICDRLVANFGRQPANWQQLLWSRFMSMKFSMMRLSLQCNDFRSMDTYTLMMLQSVHQALRTLIRPSENSIADQGVMEKISILLSNNQKDETDIDVLVNRFSTLHKELVVNPKHLQPHQHLIQWVANLALHVISSVPEFSHRKGPWVNLLSDKRALMMIRELLLLIRIWGISCESILPTFTRTTDSIDVMSKLFTIITKVKENPSDESVLDECIMLPSQVMIPPLTTSISPKGLSLIVAMSHNSNPISLEFSSQDALDPSQTNSGFMNKSFINGTDGSDQIMDCIRQIYLGRRPFVVKQCTRCCAVTLHVKDGLNPSWEKRWLKNCPCGGPWKLSCLEEKGNHS